MYFFIGKHIEKGCPKGSQKGAEMTPKSDRKPFKKTVKKEVEKLEKWDQRGVLDPLNAAGIPPKPPLGGYTLKLKDFSRASALSVISRLRCFALLAVVIGGRPQDPSRTPKRPPKDPQEPPKRPPKGPQNVPKSSQEAPKRLQTIFHNLDRTILSYL